MTDKSISEQMREWIKAEKAHPRYSDIPYDAMCRYILQDLIQEWPYKVEAVERELKATHIYLADEKRRREEAERENQKLKAQVSTMQQSMLKAIENRHEK